MSTAKENPSPRTTGFATASIILAMASILAGPFSAIPAIVCGHKALSRMRKNPAIEGYGRALAGTILGYAFLMMFTCLAMMLLLPLLAYHSIVMPAPQ